MSAAEAVGAALMPLVFTSVELALFTAAELLLLFFFFFFAVTTTKVKLQTSSTTHCKFFFLIHILYENFLQYFTMTYILVLVTAFDR